MVVDMAKRSDFAQKLLDDLRLRKEQMGTSHSSNRSNQMSADKYRYFKQTSKGLKEINPSATNGSRTRAFQSGSSNRRLAVEPSSKAMIPVGSCQNSLQIADLSMAIAFALRNGGELRKLESWGNSMESFLNNHFGRRPLDFSEMDRSLGIDRSRHPSSRFPTLSNLHIKEISRGAEKLNQILKACNNGINFDKYSIDIGKELMKGAIDLEESLRMLLSLQQASDYMVTPQRKQKIRLLEMEDDDDEITVKVNKQKHLDRPRFSFDRPSRNNPGNVQGANKISAVKQRFLALSYPKEAPQLNSEKQSPTCSKLASRSASCGTGSNSMTAFSTPKEQTISSDSRSERGRIPNVIAKLMGLEELPVNTHSKVGVQKDSHPKQGTRTIKDSTKSLQESSKKFEKVSIDSEKRSPHIAIQNMVQGSKSSATTRTSLVQYANQTKATQVPIKTGLGEGKPQPKPKSTDDIKLMSTLNTKAIKIDSPQRNRALTVNSTQIMLDKPNKKRQENPTSEEQKNSGRGEAREIAFKDHSHKMRPKMHEPPLEATNLKQETAGSNQKERRNVSTRLLVASSQQKPPQASPSQPSSKLQQSESQYAKLQNGKTKLQMKTRKGSENILKSSLVSTHGVKNQQKKLPGINHVMPSKGTYKDSSQHENFSEEESFPNRKINMKKKSLNENLEEQRPSPRGTETSGGNVALPILPVVSTKLVPIFSKREGYDTLVHRSVNPEKSQVTFRENSSPQNMAKPQPDLVTQEPKASPESTIISSKEEAIITRSNISEASTKPLTLVYGPKHDPESTSTRKAVEKAYQRLKELGTGVPNAIIQDISTKVSDSQDTSTTSLDTDQTLNSPNIISVETQGFHEGNMIGITESLEQKQHKIIKSETPRLLTENENHLKEILITSQPFLNAAEALFELQIPAAILHASTNKYHDQDSKLLLDCSYEIMKRKGRRRELSFHLHTRMNSVGCVKIRYLDDLVKELQEDIEILDSCSKHGNDEHDAADCLQQMLQKDIEKKNGDVSSMWDLGWSETVFSYLEKEQVIKDVEKHVLNGLLDEITREFLQTC